MIITLPVLLTERATAQQVNTSTAVLSERLLNAVVLFGISLESIYCDR